MSARNDSIGKMELSDPTWNSSRYTSELLFYPEDVSSVSVVTQGVIVVMYSTVILVSVGGNTLVAYSIVAQQRMKTVTNYFILNLACADMLMAVICIPFTFVANLLIRYWPFGAWMCPVVTYAQVVAVFLTAFTLVGISLDRFRAVVFPLSRRMSVRQAALVIAAIWLLSLAVPLPVAVLSRVVNVTDDDDDDGIGRERCEEVWNDQRQRCVYTTVVMILQYFLPLSVLTFTYASIGFVIWIKKTPGEAENTRDQRLAASKRKMVKMMITVVVIYALCWLPLHCITLVGDAHPSVWQFPYIQTVWIACHWLAMSNCCYNPIVYFWMNAKFRQGFRTALFCCPCVDGKPVDGAAVIYSTTRRNQRHGGGAALALAAPGTRTSSPRPSETTRQEHFKGRRSAGTSCTSSLSPYAMRPQPNSGGDSAGMLTSFEKRKSPGSRITSNRAWRRSFER